METQRIALVGVAGEGFEALPYWGLKFPFITEDGDQHTVIADRSFSERDFQSHRKLKIYGRFLAGCFHMDGLAVNVPSENQGEDF